MITKKKSQKRRILLNLGTIDLRMFYISTINQNIFFNEKLLHKLEGEYIIHLRVQI